MHNRRKTISELKLLRERQKNMNPNIMNVFSKYLLPQDSRLRLIEKVNCSNIYVFQTPNRRYYMIPSNHFTELLKGPTIGRMFREENLEVGHIYTLSNKQFRSQLVEYKQKLVEKDIYVFEDSSGIKYSINSEDIDSSVMPDSMEYETIFSGNFFDI